MEFTEYLVVAIERKRIKPFIRKKFSSEYEYKKNLKYIIYSDKYKSINGCLKQCFTIDKSAIPCDS